MTVLATVDPDTRAAAPVENGADRMLRATIRIPIPLVFDDGFEDGTADAWSSTVS